VCDKKNQSFLYIQLYEHVSFFCKEKFEYSDKSGDQVLKNKLLQILKMSVKNNMIARLHHVWAV
jgi:hypothetical protein